MRREASVGRHMFRTLKSNNEFWRAAQALAVGVTAITCALLPQPSRADQGGIGFWLPGTFGSLAATPMQPGLSMSALYLHSFVSAGGDVAASRAIGFPNRSVNLSVNLNAEIKGTADAVAFGHCAKGSGLNSTQNARLKKVLHSLFSRDNYASPGVKRTWRDCASVALSV
jgi:hypothetical protein